MTRTLATFAAAVMLTGCGTTPEPETHTVPVNTPVAVSCVPDDLLPGPLMVDPKTGDIQPDYPDTLDALKAAPELSDVLKLIDAGARLRQKRLDALEVVVEKCRQIKPLTVAK